MSITGISQKRIGDVVTVTVTSSLGTSGVYFFWYQDGVYVGMTTGPRRAFSLSGQSTVDVLDSVDPDFDLVASAPAGYPARRSLEFVRSIDAGITGGRYRVEQQENGGAWETIALVAHDPSRWSYSVLSPRLDDLAEYVWRVTPLDSAGNAGTPVTVAQELIVRTPDAPNFTAALQVSTRIAFAAA